MNTVIARSIGVGAASLLAWFLFAGPALADGLPTRGKAKAEALERPCTVSGDVGLASEYVFRGISQSNEDLTLQSTVDLTCGRFYLGVFGTSQPTGEYSTGSVKLELYGGVKTKTGPVTWDLGFKYHTYPDTPQNFDADFVELKVAASGEIWKGGTLTGTVFFSPEYIFDSGRVWTVEGTFSQTLPKVSFFTPTFSATVGSVTFDNNPNYVPDYVYWNVGVTLGFHEKWSIDLRYTDTDLGDDGCYDLTGSTSICDSRFVATLKYRF